MKEEMEYDSNCAVLSEETVQNSAQYETDDIRIDIEVSSTITPIADLETAAHAHPLNSSSKEPDESQRWLHSLEKCIGAIISIRLLSVRAFDGNGASFSVATGFIVDLKRGIVLTNRHVVTPGPVVADAIFLSKEEVDLKPIYRDPVHDFGFYQFDPSKINFLKLHEIPLHPERAKVGVEIRVVGNDAGEKLSILPGILAKLDREAPCYGTSGGSSGSPVLDIDGNAIALNAGGAKKAASSFYLPLDRIVRALKLLQNGQHVTRGTFQMILKHAAFDEVRRLGLPPSIEAQVRLIFPKETGMLIVDQVIQGGPADSKLQTGDILIQLAGKYVTTFLEIEEYLDSHVDDFVSVQFQRGDTLQSTQLQIQDLHAITPHQYLEVGGGIVHSLSYQQARNASLPVGGVYMAQTGHMFMRAHLMQPCIITALDGKPTPTLNDFASVIACLPDGYRATLRYFMIRDRHRIRTAFIIMSRLWFPVQLSTRNDQNGLWIPEPCVSSGAVSTPQSTLPSFTPAPLGFPGGSSSAKKLLLSLVMVAFDLPYMIDGISNSSYHGIGIVIDSTQGLILVDQNTVPIALGDVLVTIAASIEIQAKIVFVHPVHNYSIIQYDPKELGTIELKSAEFAESPLNVGDTAEFIGLSSNWTVVTSKSVVSKMDRLVLRDFQPPRYKASNVEVVHFDRITKSVGGVFMDSNGNVNALWFSFSYQDNTGRREVFRGLSVEILEPILAHIRHTKTIPSSVRVLPLQLLTYPLSKARSGLGLPDTWIQQMEEIYEDKRQVLGVKRCAAGTDAFKKLQSGDLILAINDQTVVRDIDVEKVTTWKDCDSVSLTIFRDHQELKLNVELTELSAMGTDRILLWCGLVIQPPHYAVASLGYIPEVGGGAYISRWCYGSPAHKYGLRATIWIVQVNDTPTGTLDSLLEVVTKLKNGDPVRIKTVAINTKPKVFTLNTDYHYWPTVEIIRHGRDWKYIAHAQTQASIS
uniref:Proapoptotic serine protease nma111like protein putative n=1 Tax=Albugo laibachii Nc14 TaxID=890382 RepID=F0VYN4_9STRA|nr:proapoptotic serine protease nma111like protein putative [Albugo laibachii Nc14]|eukprot:CCA13898.1 proapoptotic serine protease nma111like protein putative [Albugo laibachii Nc14]